jgi:tight adherence protein B
MEALIAVIIGVLIYLIIYIILGSSGKEIVRKRVSKYFVENNVDDVQEQFIKERYDEEQKNKKDKFKVASKEFSNYISSSGLKLTANEFIYLWGGVTIIPMVIVTIFGGNIITAIALGLIGIAIPPILVKNAHKKREELFNKQLSESLIIMGNSLRGGFTFMQAMESVSTDMQPPISSEFAKVLREIHYGVKQDAALTHMVERVKSKDLELLVSAVLTSQQVGSNLSEILDTISETIGDRIKIKQEIRVMTSQGRISGIVIGALPIFIILAIMVMNPEYFAGFFESFIGKILITLSIVLEVIGFAIINKIVDLKM